MIKKKKKEINCQSKQKTKGVQRRTAIVTPPHRLSK